jgi:hypothetical protein
MIAWGKGLISTANMHLTSQHWFIGVGWEGRFTRGGFSEDSDRIRSKGTSFTPWSGSSVTEKLEEHEPHSQKWESWRFGFSSNGSRASSQAATDIDTISNWKSRPSTKERRATRQSGFTQCVNMARMLHPSTGNNLTLARLSIESNTAFAVVPTRRIRWSDRIAPKCM